MKRSENSGIVGPSSAERSEGAPSPALEFLVRALDAELAASGHNAGVEVPTHDSTLMIRFAVGDAHFAVAAEQMVEIDDVPVITPLPRVAEVVSGLANLRGEIIVVLDLASFLGFEADASLSSGSRRMIVVRDAGRGGPGGILVDRIVGLSPVLPETLREPANLESFGLARPFVVGAVEVEGQDLAILDLEAFARAALIGIEV